MKKQETKITVKAPEGIDKKLFLSTYMRYMKLSRELFRNDDIYNINELPEKNEFYLPAKKMSESFGIDWENMTHEESNRIMLALLEDMYCAMSEVADKDRLVFHVKLEVKDLTKK